MRSQQRYQYLGREGQWWPRRRLCHQTLGDLVFLSRVGESFLPLLVRDGSPKCGAKSKGTLNRGPQRGRSGRGSAIWGLLDCSEDHLRRRAPRRFRHSLEGGRGGQNCRYESHRSLGHELESLLGRESLFAWYMVCVLPLVGLAFI